MRCLPAAPSHIIFQCVDCGTVLSLQNETAQYWRDKYDEMEKLFEQEHTEKLQIEQSLIDLLKVVDKLERENDDNNKHC